MIPMVDLKAQQNMLAGEINTEVLKVLDSTKFILGPNVNNFENEVKDYLKVKYAHTVASGTDALHLSLAALDINPGDEVITTPFSFISTAWAITYCGATPVFVDINPKTFNIDPLQVEKAITNKTRAIIPVHLFGQTADIQQLQLMTKNTKISIVEDCAQSFGAKVNNIQTGCFGDFGCFSFFPSKNLGAYGDGGLIVTNNSKLSEKILMLRNHGSKKRYHHNIVGYNSRLDEIQAAILRVKLKYIDEFNNSRKNIANIYTTNINNKKITTPHKSQNSDHVYHQYTLLADDRNLLQEFLTKNNISTAIYYPIPIHKQEVYKKNYGNIFLPNTEMIANSCLSIPIYPELIEEKVNFICKTINSM